ncbi:conserved Plasmodium protein, unknown function [Plasmodium malariae]|uniref:Uncharacterized protein n=1 Tax=Plasmodium malariae TaxID=5858 RepID=A0A1C3KLL3_PLAMA|nr:conserved Plasmodium protein, unknown function [Plasmodium malariae]
MIKRYLKIYPSIYFTKHVYSAPRVNEDSLILKKDYVFNQYENKKVFLNNKLKNGKNENVIKRIYYFKLWNSLCEYNFTLFENIVQQYLNEGYKYDEVIYSILVLSYILNHRKKNENAYLVVEEMKRSYMHPVIVRINERMLNSFLELEMIFCEPTKSLWMNIGRFIWEISIKLNRERKRKLKEKLSLLPPNEVLKLTKEDLKYMLKKEYENTLISMIGTMSLDSENPYEHMLIENNDNNENNEFKKYDEYNEFKKYDEFDEYKECMEKGIKGVEAEVTTFLIPQKDRSVVNSYEEHCAANNLLNGTHCLNNELHNCTSDSQLLFGKSVMSDVITAEDDARDGKTKGQEEQCERFSYISKIDLSNDEQEKMDEDETYYESFEDGEDFDIELLKKYYNFK